MSRNKGRAIVCFYRTAAAAAAKSLQSCPTLCDPIDGSPPGSPVPGTLQARTLEWGAIAFSDAVVYVSSKEESKCTFSFVIFIFNSNLILYFPVIIKIISK